MMSFTHENNGGAWYKRCQAGSQSPSEVLIAQKAS